MINMIKTTLLLIALGIGPQAADDPSGLWEVVETGVRFRIEQTDTGLRVTLGAEHPQLAGIRGESGELRGKRVSGNRPLRSQVG